nr:DUF1934 domain-containing protein [Virgibacillus halotolerans]
MICLGTEGINLSVIEKKVFIELHTIIDDDGQMEYNTIKSTGIYYQKGNIDVLRFEETSEDNAPVKNFITIQPDKVNIKRNGHIVMNQQFRMRQTTENVFRHPYGTMHMETTTNKITYQPLTEQDNGSLVMSYNVKINGQEERQHKLTLTYNEEDVR